MFSGLPTTACTKLWFDLQLSEREKRGRASERGGGRGGREEGEAGRLLYGTQFWIPEVQKYGPASAQPLLLLGSVVESCSVSVETQPGRGAGRGGKAG